MLAGAGATFGASFTASLDDELKLAFDLFLFFVPDPKARKVKRGIDNECGCVGKVNGEEDGGRGVEGRGMRGAGVCWISSFLFFLIVLACAVASWLLAWQAVYLQLQ